MKRSNGFDDSGSFDEQRSQIEGEMAARRLVIVARDWDSIDERFQVLAFGRGRTWFVSDSKPLQEVTLAESVRIYRNMICDPIDAPTTETEGMVVWSQKLIEVLAGPHDESALAA